MGELFLNVAWFSGRIFKEIGLLLDDLIRLQQIFSRFEMRIAEFLNRLFIILAAGLAAELFAIEIP